MGAALVGAELMELLEEGLESGQGAPWRMRSGGWRGCGCAVAWLASGRARVELYADEARGREQLGGCNVALVRRVGRVPVFTHLPRMKEVGMTAAC